MALSDFAGTCLSQTQKGPYLLGGVRKYHVCQVSPNHNSSHSAAFLLHFLLSQVKGQLTCVLRQLGYQKSHWHHYSFLEYPLPFFLLVNGATSFELTSVTLLLGQWHCYQVNNTEENNLESTLYSWLQGKNLISSFQLYHWSHTSNNTYQQVSSPWILPWVIWLNFSQPLGWQAPRLLLE